MTLRLRTLSAVAVAGLALTVAIATVHGQQGPGRGPGGPGRGFRPDGPFPILRQLNLTDAQKDQIKTIVSEARARTDQAAGEQKVASLHRDLQAAIFADTPDPAQIEQLRAALVEAQAAALAARTDVEAKIAQVLTPEQRKQARELAANRPRFRGRTGH